MIKNNVLYPSVMVALACIASGGLFFIGGSELGIAVLSGVLLSSLFVVSSAWVLHRYRDAESSLFMQIYFLSMGIRFLIVLLLFGFLIGMAKIDKIYFTVSFIISYLCQSITEMIFIYKFLQKTSD